MLTAIGYILLIALVGIMALIACLALASINQDMKEIKRRIEDDDN